MFGMEYWLDAAAASAERADGVTVRPLFDASRFSQRLLAFNGASHARRDDDSDEVLYVLSGTGTASLDGERVSLAEGTAAYVGRGTPWRVEAADGLVVLSVLVREPVEGGRHAVITVDDVTAASATAGRQFRLLATPDCGCASVTQFVGIIPVGRAPDHYHPYDEVVYVLEGEGALHIDGESAPLHAGACVHLPARLVHCLENTGPGELQVLGVFRPAGSPAEAYYPDGTRAVY
jgi:mannose-6-phosphate isomerase-like protein (cupin superfamily)